MFLVHILEIKNGFPNLQQFCFYMGNLVLYTGYNLWVSGRRGFVPDLDANFKLRRRAFGGGLRVPICSINIAGRSPRRKGTWREPTAKAFFFGRQQGPSFKTCSHPIFNGGKRLWDNSLRLAIFRKRCWGELLRFFYRTEGTDVVLHIWHLSGWFIFSKAKLEHHDVG